MHAGLRHHLPELRSGTKSRARGQGLVEFSLVIPIFLVILMSVFEFGFLLNGLLSINFATRDGALIAAEAGDGGFDAVDNTDLADCVILEKIEQDVTAPANPANIQQVQIFWVDDNGQPLDTSGNVTTAGSSTQAVDVYTRTGSMTCNVSDQPTFTVPYTLGTYQYPSVDRCDDLGGTLAGCQAGHNGLDTIAVEVTYRDYFVTPLHNFIGPLGSYWTITQSNEMRMEPVL
jgi:hypothetical protein